MAGFVPQVTCGSTSAPLMTSVSSYSAPSSVASSSHSSARRSYSSPSGTCLLPRRNSTVVSSGLIRPALAPASIDILQIIILHSIGKSLIALSLSSSLHLLSQLSLALIIYVLSLEIGPLQLVDSMFLVCLAKPFVWQVRVHLHLYQYQNQAHQMLRVLMYDYPHKRLFYLVALD